MSKEIKKLKTTAAVHTNKFDNMRTDFFDGGNTCVIVKYQKVSQPHRILYAIEYSMQDAVMMNHSGAPFDTPEQAIKHAFVRGFRNFKIGHGVNLKKEMK